jgi:poly(glycerol-phosphate) alpha-glucosyltransferase
LDRWALNNARWKKRVAAWLYENDHLQAAACIHALCESELTSIRDFGLQNPVCVIPNGVEIPAHSSTRDAPWEGQIPVDQHVLLFLGRLHPKKGLPNLIVAWENWKNTDPTGRKWRLAVAGWSQGGHKEELEQQVAARGLQDDIEFLGPLYGAEKQAAFTNADAFILPSYSEGLPMAVLEAWSYQLPVIMTPQCNIPTGFEAKAALRIDPNPSSIVEGLGKFARMEEDERASMGGRGRALVEQQFTWARVAEQMHHVYRWVLGTAEQPDCVVTDTKRYALS